MDATQITLNPSQQLAPQGNVTSTTLNAAMTGVAAAQTSSFDSNTHIRYVDCNCQILIFIERDYPIEYLHRISKQLLNSLRCMIEENLPYKILREEIEKQYFDPLNNAKRFERSLNHISSLPGGISAPDSTE